jgi:hypothetical protein
MAYANWNGIPNGIFVVHRPSGRIVKVVASDRDGASYIDSFPIPERYDYYNASRYALAKSGLFPKTKAGDAALQKAVADLGG